ncbi:YqiA/YcfP family alpha/beta fold hydrolase, partial [Escherichia coli]|uniref:YqiA/YcfP family alpha/beta fold hydrolase n=1 Tax=Escherichia coli TaxID=562 RepID=UPI003A91B2D4
KRTLNSSLRHGSFAAFWLHNNKGRLTRGCNPAYSKSIHTWLRFGEIMRGSLSTKCVTNFREKNRDRCLVILSRNDEALNSQRTSEELHHYYEIVWDEEQTHKFKNISPHLQRIKAFKTLG